MKSSELKSIIKEEIVKILSESPNGNGVYVRGIESIIKRYPNLPLEGIVQDFLRSKEALNISDLSSKDALDLNLLIQKSLPSKTVSNKSDINPYKGNQSKGYMGSSYTGD